MSLTTVEISGLISLSKKNDSQIRKSLKSLLFKISYLKIADDLNLVDYSNFQDELHPFLNPMTALFKKFSFS